MLAWSRPKVNQCNLPDIVTESILHVDETSVATLGNLVDGLEVGVGKLDALEVAVDS